MPSNAAKFETMARVYINQSISELPTLEEISNIIDSFKPVGNMMYQISEDDFQQIKRELIEEMAHTIGTANILRQRRDNDQKPDWYTCQEIKGYYWPRFKNYLKAKRSPDIVEKLDRLTDQIMNCLADPNSELDLQKRGLMMGEVQSGKTEAYTALCNKAADCGYKVIIVLTGMTEALRTQTQSRLDSELVGLESKYSLEQNEKLDLKNKPMGVGLVKHDQDKIINRFTSVTTDFNKNTIKNNGLSLSNLGKAEPSLFVIKKNSSVMRNLYNWLTKDSNILDLPLLLVDDEADNASLNTNSAEHDPTAINRWINKILRAFKKASYLGVTATPFANIFVNDRVKDDGAAEDLFPRDFLIMLSVPDNYIGAKDIFGFREVEDTVEKEAGDYGYSLVPIENSEQENYYRYKHKINLAERLHDLPESLYEAVRYFVVVSAIKDFQQQKDRHFSMLVNVSRFTNVQDKTAALIQDYLDSIVSDLLNYSKIERNLLKFARA
ncbi:Z1 domain-containing protein [Ileibacterium valens]|uniref:Z1 domain-containing protein n=1 Tax=Ileibacterium valens TaxID=1862668 RepID=UPI0024BA1609|nr:Z1 domain-containing protein [Ileibacterium valens]